MINMVSERNHIYVFTKGTIKLSFFSSQILKRMFVEFYSKYNSIAALTHSYPLHYKRST